MKIMREEENRYLTVLCQRHKCDERQDEENNIRQTIV